MDVLQHCCDRCGARTEARIEHGKILLGYVYAAGAPHFASMVEIAATNLVVSHEPDALVVTHGSQVCRIPRQA